MAKKQTTEEVWMDGPKGEKKQALTAEVQKALEDLGWKVGKAPEEAAN